MKKQTFKTKYKELYKFYSDKIKSPELTDLSMNTFMAFLRFLRDYRTFTEDIEVNDIENIRIVTLHQAITEYYNCTTCADNYFKMQNGKLESIVDGLTLTQAIEAYNKEKRIHWGLFWEIVKNNIETWLE